MTDTDFDRDLERARALTQRGDDAEAMAAYAALVGRAPTHFQALTELGKLAFARGYRSAARTVYEQAVRCHPGEALGRVNLGNVLSVSDETADARHEFEAALALQPDLAAAHRGLALICAEEGDEAGARDHRERGFRPEPTIDKPFRGIGSAPTVLLIVSARGGNIPTDLWLNDRAFHITAIYAEYADLVAGLPPHDLVFNAIGDADLCGEGLTCAETIIAKSSKPVINPPGAVGPTGRLATAERFAHLPGIRTPQTTLNAIAELRSRDKISFPALLRRPGFHTGRHFERIEHRIAFISALDRFEADGAHDLFLIEYMDARGPDGRARKYRVMFIDGGLYPLHLAISNDWKVHYFTAAMADDAAFRAEEAAFLTDPVATIGAHGWAALQAVAAELGLDYAGIDFGLDPDRELLLFEANATMVLIPPAPEAIWDYRRPAIGRAIEAATSMVTRRIADGKRLPESRAARQDSAA